MGPRHIRGIPEPPDDEKADKNDHQAQEYEGEQASLKTAASSLLLMLFLL